MPSKTKTAAAADKVTHPAIPVELLEELIPGPVTPAQLEDVFQRFKKAFIERALGAELSQHLGYATGHAKPAGVTNHRNGKSAKTVLTDLRYVYEEILSLAELLNPRSLTSHGDAWIGKNVRNKRVSDRVLFPSPAPNQHFVCLRPKCPQALAAALRPTVAIGADSRSVAAHP